MMSAGCGVCWPLAGWLCCAVLCCAVQAEIVRQGSDVTLVGWGAQMRVLEQVRRRRLAV
eukprot:COSAG01_NODE_3310_length_6282_cov_2.911693_3_plen_59_part_00